MAMCGPTKGPRKAGRCSPCTVNSIAKGREPMSILAQGYARVSIWKAGSQEPCENSAFVYTVRPAGQRMTALALDYEDAVQVMDWRITDQDDTELTVINREANAHIVVYIDYFRDDGNPQNLPPQSSQDTFTLNPGWSHRFSANAFLKVR